MFLTVNLCRHSLAIGAALLAIGALTGCGGGSRSNYDEQRESRANAYPANYKSDLLAFLHVYLNDPTGVRDAYLTDPMMKRVGARDRFVVCVRFNAKGGDGRYTGNKEGMALFRDGRFDQFTELAKEFCSQAEFKPFPELEKLSR